MMVHEGENLDGNHINPRLEKIFQNISRTDSKKVEGTSLSEKGVDPIEELPGDTAVYKRRFWILGVFFYTLFVNTLIWTTFAPILQSVKYTFGWTNSYIALLNGFGPIMTLIYAVPLSWTSQNKGLRTALLLASGTTCIAAGLRCLPLRDLPFQIIVVTSSILNGLGYCLTSSIMIVSSTWFPQNERTTATAVGSLSTQFGLACTYLAPLIVRTPNDELTKDEIAKDINLLLYIIFGLAAFGFLCVIVYFPDKPKKPPPGTTPSITQFSYFKSISLLVKDMSIFLVILANIISRAVPYTWVTVMNFSLSCLGISQDKCMWIGIAANIFSPLMAFIAARITDRFYGYLKATIIFTLLVSSCFFLFLLFMGEKIIPASYETVFMAVLGGLSIQNASVPLLISLSVDMAFPCSESAVGAALIITLNFIDICIYGLLMIPSQCFRWLNFALVGGGIVSVVLLGFVKNGTKISSSELTRLRGNYLK